MLVFIVHFEFYLTKVNTDRGRLRFYGRDSRLAKSSSYYCSVSMRFDELVQSFLSKPPASESEETHHSWGPKNSSRSEAGHSSLDTVHSEFSVKPHVTLRTGMKKKGLFRLQHELCI